MPGTATSDKQQLHTVPGRLKYAGITLAAFAGAAVMVVELGVARVLTPVFGGSISVWAIVIATTMLALASLAIFGGEVLRGITMAMIWGIVIGTYSSIFIGAPLLSFMGAYVDRTPKPGPGDVPAEADGTQP